MDPLFQKDTNSGSPFFLFKKKITRKNAKLTFLKFVKDKTIQPNIPLPIYIFKFEAFSFSLSFSKFSNVSHHIHIIVKRHSMTKTFLRYTQVLVISNKLKNLPETNTNTYGINSKDPHKNNLFGRICISMPHHIQERRDDHPPTQHFGENEIVP
jgi:hypothetical protein